MQGFRDFAKAHFYAVWSVKAFSSGEGVSANALTDEVYRSSN